MLNLTFQRGFRSGIQKVAARTFSIDAVAQTSYDRFRTAYVANYEMLKKKQAAAKVADEVPVEPVQTHYPAHEMDHEYNPVLLSTLADDSFIQDVVGPEQVSPHYESFGVSRKWALLTIGGYMGMNYMGQVIDLHWVFQSMLIPFISYLTIIYWNVEGKKSYFMPIQYEWYNKLSHHEMDLLHAFWPDQVREKIRQNQRVAREQMEYYEVHTDFNDIKAESVNRFLANEQTNMKIHVHNRAVHLLENAFALEQQNRNRVINDVVSNAIIAVDKTLEANKQQIEDQMFESALIGIKRKQMTYENDPILPLVQQTIKESVSKVTSLSAEEQNKLVNLTADQLATLKAADARASEAYLKIEPVIEASLKSYSQINDALKTWGQ